MKAGQLHSASGFGWHIEHIHKVTLGVAQSFMLIVPARSMAKLMPTTRRPGRDRLRGAKRVRHERTLTQRRALVHSAKAS
jgi:hypothetical protein